MELTLLLTDDVTKENLSQSPSLNQILKFGNFEARHLSLEAEFFSLLPKKGDSLEWADYSRKSLNLQGGYPYWLYADPVQLQLDHRTVYLLGNEQLEFTQEETQSLMRSLEPLFPPGLQLLIQDNAWFINSEKPFAETKSLRTQINQSLHTIITTNKPANWLPLWTELQMQLYTHPVNVARRQSGKPTLDALWFWGNERCLKQGENGLTVLSDWALAKAVCLYEEVPCYSLPASLECPPRSQSLVAILPQRVLTSPISDRARSYEENWFLKSLQQLEGKKLETLKLIVPGLGAWCLKRSHFWRIWRKG